uniref:Uncharacterized protein n=1 Tax=Tetranychus urticae TaxID=32264 RepID=T1JV57_TETUR
MKQRKLILDSSKVKDNQKIKGNESNNNNNDYYDDVDDDGYYEMKLRDEKKKYLQF